MKINADLVFKKSYWALVGFTEMGNVNEEFSELEKLVESSKEVSDRTFATNIDVCLWFVESLPIWHIRLVTLRHLVLVLLNYTPVC